MTPPLIIYNFEVIAAKRTLEMEKKFKLKLEKKRMQSWTLSDPEIKVSRCLSGKAR
jgi:hypothetical protein